jgi:CRP-like cAMP-binding protein
MMKTKPVAAELNRLRDFGLRALSRRGALDDDDDKAVRQALAEMQSYPAGHELIAEGEPLNRPCLLLEGWAVRQRVLSDGRRQIFSFVLPGDGVGLCARPDGVALQTTLALTPVTLAPMPLLNQRLHGPAKTPLSELAWNMVSLDESFLVNQVMRLGRQSAYERLIHLLLEFHDRLKTGGSVEERSFVMPFTQEVLSDALGLSTVHTNRVLQQLRRERLIETHAATVRLVDPVLLSEIADYHKSPRFR